MAWIGDWRQQPVIAGREERLRLSESIVVESGGRNMKTLSSRAGLIVGAALVLGIAALGRADVISANFYDVDQSWWGAPLAGSQTLAPTDVAGAFAAAGWQNIPVDSNSPMPSGVVLTNSNNAATTATLTFHSQVGAAALNGIPEAYFVGWNGASGWTGDATQVPTATATQKLYGAYVGTSGNDGRTMEFTLANIPYANYSIYLYLLTQSNSSASAELFTPDGGGAYGATPTQTGYAENGGWTYWNTGPSSYVASTGGFGNGADYVQFSGLSGATQSIDINDSADPAQGGGGIGLAGFQIVAATPEPASAALLILGALPLVLRRKK
jgi:hypothetical protein